MNLQLFTKWYVKYVLLALSCIILLVVPLLKGPWAGDESLLFFRLAQEPSWYDSLSSGGQFAAYQWGTPLVLSAAPGILIQILPFILGMLCVVVLRKILSYFSEDIIFINVTLLLFILSPAFIYMFSFTNSLFIAFFLSLVGFYFFIQKKRKWFCVPIFLVLPLFNFILTLAALTVFLFYSIFIKKERIKVFFILLLISLVSTSLYLGYVFYNAGLPQSIDLEFAKQFVFFQKLFFDLGSQYGLGIFISLLAIVGMVIYWEKKYANLFIFFSFLVLLILSLIRAESLPLLSIFCIILAAYGLIALFNIQWNSLEYRNFIILLIISGLVFSSISQLNALIEMPPSETVLEGLTFLSEQEEGIVFTDYTRGVWINAAGHVNLLDWNYKFVNDAEQRFMDSQEIFYSRDLKVTNELFEKYNVTYVWIDQDMKKNIWKYDTEGLLFILEYTKDFEKIYDEDGIEIWRIEQ